MDAEQFATNLLDAEIRLKQMECLFPGHKLTLLVRHPTATDCDHVLTNDELPTASSAIKRLYDLGQRYK